jgi:hypothetical protein
MMTKIRAWKTIVIAIILVGEPLLFTFKFPISVPLLLLKQTWPIQAVICLCLALLGMTKMHARKTILLTVVFVGETLLFTSNDRAFALPIILLMLSFPFQVFIGFYRVLLSPKISAWPMFRRTLTIGIAFLYCLWISIFITSFLWQAERIRNATQLGEYSYFLTTRVSWSGPGCDFFCGFTVPTLYKCNSLGLECVSIFNNDFINVSASGLVVDKDTSELQLHLSFFTQGLGFHKYGLSYVYGEQPRIIENSEKFGDSIYYLTTPQNQEPPSYMLYKCNQDSLDCKRLPFEYNIGKYADLWADIDDTGKLTVTNVDELLIYTYDTYNSQPVCHLDGCTLKSQ